MVQVTCDTQLKQEAALTRKIYKGRKERMELIRAILKRGSLSALIRISSSLNSREAREIERIYAAIIHYDTAVRLLAVFPASRGYVPVRNWLIDAALKAPLKYLTDMRLTLNEKFEKSAVWWPRAALKRKVEIDRFFERVTSAEKGKYTHVLGSDPEFFDLLTDEQKKIVKSAK